MQPIIEFISKPWVGSILGVLGLAAAVFFYFRSRRVSRLAYQNDGLTLVGGAKAAFPAEVTISFAGEQVDRVTASRYVIWNAGNTTLDGKNVVSADPLRLELGEDGQILKYEILRTTRGVNAFNLNPRADNPNILDLTFDYLDAGDGIAIEVLHSGARRDLSLYGTIRGLPAGVSYFGRGSWYLDRRLSQSPFPFRMRFKFLTWFALVFGIVTAVAGLFRPSLYEWFPKLAEKNPEDITKPNWPMFIAGAVYAALPLFLMWFRRRRYPSALEPSQNEEAEQDGAGQPAARSESE